MYKSIGNVFLIKAALVSSSILSYVYPLKHTHVATISHWLSLSLTLCFVSSSYLRRHFSQVAYRFSVKMEALHSSDSFVSVFQTFHSFLEQGIQK